MKRIIKGLLVGFYCLLSINIQAQYSGKCGDNAEYNLDKETGILRISGKGEVWDMTYKGVKQPWIEVRSEIKKIIVEEGITKLNFYAISFNYAEEIELPLSLKEIIMGNFCASYKIKRIILPKNLSSIDVGNFYKCDELIEITSENPTPPAAGILSPDGLVINYSFTYGVDLDKVTLTVPEGSVEKYKVADGWKEFKYIQAIRKNTNANLESLKLNFDIEPAFNKDTTDYYATVGSDIEQVNITAKPEDGATVKYNDFQVLKDGDNEIIISVTAEDITVVKKYCIHVYRKSAESRLKNITINGGSLAPTFNPDIKVYTSKISKSHPDITVIPAPMHDKAKVETPASSQTKDTTLIIKVTAEDERHTKSYRINVEVYESNAYLKDLRVEGFELKQEFQRDVYRYDLTVPKNTKEVNIIAVQEDENARISGETGRQQITEAENLFTINVVSEDKMQLRTYQIRVQKEVSTDIEKVEDFYDERVSIYTVDGRYLGTAERYNKKIIIPDWLGHGIFIAKGSKYREKFTN
jgi:hypothetical protein